MGGIPSRESPSLFSYFRGSYEVGLIPLTKQFFGREDEEPRHAVGSSSGQNQYKGVNRGQLRRQLLLMRQDPAVRYSNSRDSHSIIQSIMAFLEKEDKKTTSLGDLPTEKDVHTSPLRSSSAATSSEALPEKGERGTATAAANEISLGELGEDLEAALHDLVKDPAEIVRVREAIWKHYWSVMPENHFTESDLDAFLNLVEATLYDTDRDMLLDPLYPKPDHAQLGENSSSASRPSAFFPVPCALCLAYPEGKERDGCFTLDGRNINIIGYFGLLTQDMERALKVSKRDCSSSKSQMNGGEQVQQNGSADVPKHVFSLPKSRTSLDTLDSMRADGAVYETLNKPENYKSAGEHELFLNTAILTSAGDRTLERVLVLAAVMLRQQFHAAYRRYLIQKKELSACAIPSGAIESTSGLNPPVHIITAPQANPVYATSSIPGVSIPTSALSNPLLGCTLPPLPSNMFTPLPLGGSPEAIANAAITHSYFLRPGKPDSSTSSSQLQWIEGTGSQHYVCEQGGVSGGLISISAAEEDSMSQALANRLEQLAVSIEIASNNYTSLKSLTENFAFLHCQVSLDSDDACMELVDLPVISSNTAVSFEKQSNNNSVNNISSYSVQNASMSSKNHAMAGEPEGMSSRSMSHDVHLDSVGSPVQNREDGPSEKPQDHSAFQLSPSSAIILHMQPSYFRQSCMWASCLFHFPARLLGHWVQYKLKDECDHLRHVLQNKDMLIAQWRQFHREHALSYLGEHTVRLLQHVRALQDETERARTLPITNWDPDNLFINLDGRKYALHNSQFGTMLIGVRTPHATGANTSSSNNIGSFSGKRNGNSSSALDFMHEHANDLNAQRNRNAPMHFPAGVAYNNGATFLAAAPQTMHMSPPQFHNVTTMAGPTGPAAVPTALPGSVAMMMGRTPPQAHGVVPQPMYPAFQASPGAIPFTVASGNTAAMPMGAQNAYIISPGSGKITPGIATGPPSSTASPAQNIVYMDQSHTMMMNGMRMMLPTCSSQALNPVSQPPVSSSPQASPGNLVLAGPLPTTANPNTYHDPRNFARTALPQMSSSPTGAPFFPLQTAGVPAPTAYYLGSMGETPGNKASMPSVVSGNDLTPGMSSFELPSVLPTRPVADYTGGHSNNPSNNSSRHTLPSTTVLHPSFQSPSVPLMASSPGQFVSNTQNITNTVKPGGSAPPQFTYTLCNGVPVMCVPQMDAQAVPTRVDTTSGTVPANPLQPPQSQSSTSQHPMYTLSMSPPGGFQQPQSAPSFMYQPTYF